MTARFEAAWAAWNGPASVAFGGWTGGALAALDYAGRPRARRVLCPSNTFMATPLAISARAPRPSSSTAAATTSACRSTTSSARLERPRRRAAVLVHIGGHIAFDVRAHRRATAAPTAIFLHRGLRPRPRRRLERPPPGTYGDAGVYSLLRDEDDLDRRGRHARLPRRRAARPTPARFATTASPTTRSHGLNFRISEFTAAIGLVQTERLEEIVAPKNAVARELLDPQHPNRLELPDGHDLRPLQVHRLRPDRALDRPGLRRALPPDHGHRRRPAEHRLGRRQPLVRPALLRARRRCREPSRPGGGVR